MHPLAVVPVTMNVLFAFFVRPRTWIDPLDEELLIVAFWPVFAVAVNVVQGDVYVGAVKTTVRVTPPTAAVAVHEFLAASHPSPATSPRMTGTPASAALSSEPPQPARSRTAHAMTAPASLAEPLPKAPNRPKRALIVDLASPGPSPTVLNNPERIENRQRPHYRVSTVVRPVPSGSPTPPGEDADPPQTADADRVHGQAPTACRPPSGCAHSVDSVRAAEFRHHPAKGS